MVTYRAAIAAKNSKIHTLSLKIVLVIFVLMRTATEAVCTLLSPQTSADCSYNCPQNGNRYT